MPISFSCPHCGHETQVANQYAGQSGSCRRRSETVAPVGEWPPDEKCSARMITCGFQIRLSEIPKLSELASCGGQGCTATWSSGLRFAVAS